jgi:membrane-associated phospholipid phosphatase
MRSLRESLTCVGLVIGLSVASLASPALAQTLDPAPAESPALSRLFKTTLADFRRLPSNETLRWLVMGGSASSAGHILDWDISNSFSGTHRVDGFFRPGRTIGGARAQIAGAITTYVVGRIGRQPRIARLGSDLVRAQLVTQTLTAGIKLSARRTRPDGGEYSFPSGHSSVTFATAPVVQRHFGWKGGIPAYALASYVAASRVQTRRHFTSDVAFGAAIGIVAGRTVTVGRGNARFTASPDVSPQKAGVSFTLVN